MSRPTPFHPRTTAANHGWAYKEWAGFVAPCSYDRHSEREYVAFRHTVGVIDVSPLYKLDVRGPDAAALVARCWSRDVTQMAPGRVVYATLSDDDGYLLDDGTITMLARDHVRVTSSEPWWAWMHDYARGLDVRLTDVSHLAALAIQGPLAADALAPLLDFDLTKMRFFRARRAKLASRPVLITRTGYTGDLGYEVFCEPEHALAVWDAIFEAGAPHGIEPCGLDALDVVRIEAGFVLQGVDYVTARLAPSPKRKSTAYEAGLGWTVELDRAPFVGQRAIREEVRRGPAWATVGLELSWEGLEALYARYDLPPHLAPIASRASVPVYDGGKKQIGQVTSSTWSPLLKRYLAIAQVQAKFATLGTQVQVEHTVDYERGVVGAVVAPRPFFDPPRKKAQPAPRSAS
jgi:aminomethyltransferase